MERKPSGESTSAKAPPRMRQGRRFRQFSGRVCRMPPELRGRRRRIGSGRGFPTSGAFRTARLIAVLRKCPSEASSRGPSSAAFFPPQPDFSRPKSGGLLIFAYSLLATLPKSTPPAESQIRRGSSVSRGVLLSRGGVFQAEIVLGPLISHLLPRGPLRDSGPSQNSAHFRIPLPVLHFPGEIRDRFAQGQSRIVD